MPDNGLILWQLQKSVRPGQDALLKFEIGCFGCNLVDGVNTKQQPIDALLAVDVCVVLRRKELGYQQQEKHGCHGEDGDALQLGRLSCC